MARSAEIFNQLEVVARSTGDQVFMALLPGAKTLFGVFFGIWLTWTLVDKGLFKKELTFEGIYKPLLVSLTIGLFLQSPAFYKEWFFEPFYQTATLLLQTVLKTTSLNGSPATIQGVLTAIENEVDKIIALTNAIRSDSSFYRLDHTLMAFILRFAFHVLWLLYLSFATEFVFGLMFVTALFPLIAVCLGFERTRNMGVLALKIPVHGAMTLVVGSLALSFLFSTIHSSVAALPINDSGLQAGAAEWTYTTGYDTLLIIVVLAALFLMKSAQYVASFLHINVGVGANMAMAGAGALALSMAKKSAVPALLKGGDIATKGSQWILDRMRGKN